MCGLSFDSLPFKVADVPGVIKILDWFESAESFFIVMEKFVGQVNNHLHPHQYIVVHRKPIKAFLLTFPY